LSTEFQKNGRNGIVMKEERFKELLESVRKAGAIMRGEKEPSPDCYIAPDRKRRYEEDPVRHSHWEIDHE